MRAIVFKDARAYFIVLFCFWLENLGEKRMTRRTYLAIMAEILNFCRKPQCKTRVMYHSNLSWKVFQKYISMLESKELLQVHHSPMKYVTTQEGLKFIEKWSQVADLLRA
jgi:predicted transcriptional regulator